MAAAIGAPRPTGGAALTGAPHVGPRPIRVPAGPHPTAPAARPTPPPAAGGKGAPHLPTSPQGVAGHWVQQGGRWTLIHAVGPGHWAQGPKPGFNAPPKPKVNAAPAAPDWLAPLTPQQVQKQATSMISQIYAPANNALNQIGSQEQAIMNKQTADNQYYMQWLNSKSMALDAQQQVVDQSTNQLEQQLTGNMTSVLGAQDQAMTNAANERPGNVTNNAPSFAPGSALGNATNTVADESLNAENANATRTLAQEGIAQQQIGAAAQNSAAFVEAGQLKQDSAFQSAMSKIATEKSSLLSRESSSLASEISKLNTQQIALSENNRNYAAATARIGISAANTQSEIASRAASTKLRQASLALQGKKLQNTIAEESIKNAQSQERINQSGQRLTLDQQKYLLSVANTNSEVALRNAETYQKLHGILTPSEQNTQFSMIDKATGEINSIMGQYGLSGPQAYQAVLSGGFYGHGVNSKGQQVVKHITVPRMANQSMLNAAYNLRAGGPGLNAGDLGYLQRLGLQNVAQRYAGRIAQTHKGSH